MIFLVAKTLKISFFETMKRKNIILSILLILLIVKYCVLPIFKDSNTPLTNSIAEYNIASEELISLFKNDEKRSNKIYAGKIIEVTGIIKEINFLNDRNTVILKSATNNFGIICDINEVEKDKLKLLKINQQIKVKGICKGYLKDVILLNCSIELPTNE